MNTKLSLAALLIIVLSAVSNAYADETDKTKFLRFNQGWTLSNIQGAATVAICPIESTSAVCAGYSPSTGGSRWGFKVGVNLIPLKDYLEHIELSPVTIVKTTPEGTSISVNYEPAIPDQKPLSKAIEGGWVSVIDGDQKRYVVCPGEISGKGSESTLRDISCEHKGKKANLLFLEDFLVNGSLFLLPPDKWATGLTNDQLLAHKSVSKMHVIEAANTLNVSYLEEDASPSTPALPDPDLKIALLSNNVTAPVGVILIAVVATLFVFFAWASYTDNTEYDAGRLSRQASLEALRRENLRRMVDDVQRSAPAQATPAKPQPVSPVTKPQNHNAQEDRAPGKRKIHLF